MYVGSEILLDGHSFFFLLSFYLFVMPKRRNERKERRKGIG